MTPHFLVSFLKGLLRIAREHHSYFKSLVICRHKSYFYEQFWGFFLEWNCFVRLFHFLFGDTKEHKFPFSWY